MFRGSSTWRIWVGWKVFKSEYIRFYRRLSMDSLFTLLLPRIYSNDLEQSRNKMKKTTIHFDLFWIWWKLNSRIFLLVFCFELKYLSNLSKLWQPMKSILALISFLYQGSRVPKISSAHWHCQQDFFCVSREFLDSPESFQTV